MRRGIILAGGIGTRLYPLTRAGSKQLMPIYDKPMIYYPLSVLMLAGVREILVITRPADRGTYEQLLGDGAAWGLELQYGEQERPAGVAEALRIGASFVGGGLSILALGDNIHYGNGLMELLARADGRRRGATIFSYPVADPTHYGVVEFDDGGRVMSLEEKPARPKSSYAITGLYFYDARAVEYAAALKPSARRELEITDLNRLYLEQEELYVEMMGRGFTWLDVGTHQSLLDAALFIKVMEDRQGLKIGCPEEVAWRCGYIDAQQLEELAMPLCASGYGQYLLRILRK